MLRIYTTVFLDQGAGAARTGRACPVLPQRAAVDQSELVNFHDQRFGMNLSGEQKRDLVVFLNSL